MPTARINGVETFYEVEGEGTPVLYIHGGFGGAESTLFPKSSAFRGALPADRFQTITYDRRNSGRSEYRNAEVNINLLATDARALLDHLGIERAVILGDSLGGQIAMRFGLSFPDRVISLLLAETGAKVVRKTLKAEMAIAMTKHVPPRVLIKLGHRRAVNPPFYDPLGPETPEKLPNALARHEAYKQKLQSLPEDELTRYSMGILRNYAAFIGLDLSDRLHELEMPVDIVHGTADTVVPVTRAPDLKRLIPQAHLYLLEGLGHGLFYYPKARESVAEILAPYGTAAGQAAVSVEDGNRSAG